MPQYLSTVDAYIQRVTSIAYSNINLLSNQVLSRNPYTNNLFRDLLFETKPLQPSLFRLLKRLLSYYTRSLLSFMSYAVTYSILRLFNPRQADCHLESLQDLYLVDTYVLTDSLLRSRNYDEEHYFVGLTEALRKYGKKSVIIPKFSPYLRTPWRALKAIRLLAASDFKIVTEFQLLRYSDLLRILYFILRYPIDVLSLSATISPNSLIDELFISQLQETISQVTFYGFVRYLVGRRLGAPAGRNLKLISWFENQVLDKNLYRGLKSAAPNSVIYGCQCFIAYPTYINAYVAEAESKHLVTPDRVLVNGPAYLKPAAPIEHRLGVSFRYRTVFTAVVDWTVKKRCVIFLTNLTNLNHEIITVCAKSALLQQQTIVVATHPTSSDRALPQLPSGWHYEREDKASLLETAAILIASESSAAVEAVALGTSVIMVASQSTFTSNPLLEIGRGEIWDLAIDSDDLGIIYEKLIQYRSDNPARVRELAEFYRGACFVEPTEENILKSLDIAPTQLHAEK